MRPRTLRPSAPGAKTARGSSARTGPERPRRALRIAIARLARHAPLRAARVRAALRAVARAHHWRGDLCLAVVDDAAIAALNRRFRRARGPTDVLAFPYGEDADGVAGEIIVSAETAARAARAFGEPPERELLRYCIHGLLHLCGREDGVPAARRAMRAQEDRFLPPREEFRP
ncbi:MAG: Endoribonuclease YbeY [Planctomycetes bacterium ADurb.Bin069]|nr:MAG: Endoribonuclease YbeY [Planctomycetes bacterium ADurb.Bin069]